MKAEIMAVTLALTPLSTSNYVEPFRPSIKITAPPMEMGEFVDTLKYLDGHANTSTAIGQVTASTIDLALQGYRLGWKAGVEAERGKK